MAHTWMEAERRLIDAELERALPPEASFPQTLHRAMRYSVFAGGKRLRPLLLRAAARAAAGADVENAIQPAAAVELVHTYSLIHDDLPALDNDDLRRGRATCHKVFGEATAILAGDALLTLAFARLAAVRPHGTAVRLIDELTRAAGSPAGMVGGQVADLEARRESATAESLHFVHRNKTAALMRAAAAMGAITAGAPGNLIETLGEFGEAIGLAFQVVDDILDVTGTAKQLGKSAGKDEAQKKVTFPAVFGMEESRRRAEQFSRAALALLAPLGPPAERLRALADLMVHRAS